MTPDVVDLDPTEIRLRHIKKVPAGTPAATAVLGQYFLPTWEGLNADGGWGHGMYQPRRDEHGDWSITLPNAAGSDGVLHRERFLLLTDPSYRPGDEWIEVYEDGDLVWVGTPVSWQINRGTLTISGFSGDWLGHRVRETDAGFWCAAPRDVFEYYTRAWRAVLADDFTTTTIAHSTGIATTGAWRHRLARTTDPTSGQPLPGGAVRLATADTTTSAFLQGDSTSAIDFATQKHWRIETRIAVKQLPDAGEFAGGDLLFGAMSEITGAEGDSSAAGPRFTLGLHRPDNVFDTSAQTRVSSTQVGLGTTRGRYITKLRGNDLSDLTLAIEQRGAWAFFYVNGKLVAVEPSTNYASATVRPTVEMRNDSGSPIIEVRELLYRRSDPFLMRSAQGSGDRHLPGVPPPGGLQGSYFDGGAKYALHGSLMYTVIFTPGDQPYARRIDPTVDFTSAGWQPPGAPAQRSGVRWVGAIYLDLAAEDWTLSVTNLYGKVAVWIGNTDKFSPVLENLYGGEGVNATVTSAGLRSLLGQTSGWYPIIIEYSVTGSTTGLRLQWGSASTPLQVVPSSKLSPFGVYEDHVRHESHAEQLATLVETFAIQYVCEPRQLESGQFPGLLTPKVRVGRDTDHVIDDLDAADVQASGTAEETATSLLADAQGIADPTLATQISVEALDYTELADHLLIHTDAESLADIGVRNLLEQRLTSLLALRGSPWEEVQARPRGTKKFTDTFPLTGALARFKWEPGDGVRVSLAEIGVEDLTTRHLRGVQWPIAPAGRGRPTVAFRQRPRGLRQTLRRMLRTTLTQQRNYQGQLTILLGSVGSRPASSANPDTYSRITLPRDRNAIAKAELVVHAKSDSSSMDIEVNGRYIMSITREGRYDITDAISTNVGNNPRAYVALTFGTGAAEYQVELTVAH